MSTFAKSKLFLLKKHRVLDESLTLTTSGHLSNITTTTNKQTNRTTKSPSCGLGREDEQTVAVKISTITELKF